MAYDVAYCFQVMLQCIEDPNFLQVLRRFEREHCREEPGQAMPQEYERRMSADGSFLVRKLLIVLRLLSLGRHRRRASCSIVARQSARKLADPLTEAEAEFLGKVLSFVPVMARTSKLMRPFLDEGDGSLHELAARTLHQAKVMTIRTVWKDLMEPLKEEMEKFKNRNVTLQDQFREARTEFLKEISTLRDEVRIRGDPEKALGDGSLDEMVGNLGTVCHCPFLMENPAWLMSRGGPL
eukprot:g24591.t1